MVMRCTHDYRPDQVKLYSDKKWWLGRVVGDVLDKNANLYPDKEALVGGEARYTYSELRAAADRMACGLLKAGFQRGDRVMLQLPNWPEFIVSFFAIQKAGLVMVLLTVNHTVREVAHLAALSEAKAWILPARYRGKDNAALIGEVRGLSPALETIIVAGGESLPGCLGFGELSAENLAPQAIRQQLESARPDPEDVCFLLPSGGTTGLPKCAVRTHNDYLCNVEYKSLAWDINTTDVSLVAATVGHNLAVLVGICGPLFHGAKIVLVDSTYPADICEVIEKERITCIAMVPTLISRVVNHEDLGRHDLSSLIKVYVGAANSPPDLVKRVEERLGARYINAFGMVEGPCSQTRFTDSIEVRTGTIGRPICPYDDIRTLDERGAKSAPGVEGELAARGPGVFSGYYRNSAANQSAFTPDGYFRTGDLAVISPEGYIRITGRIKDIIIRGGENISARDVEDIISAHPDVEYVAAVAKPHTDLGEEVCAFVKPVDGRELSYESIVDHMKRSGAAKAMIPGSVEIVSEIPLTAAGKADKKVLREIVRKKG